MSGVPGIGGLFQQGEYEPYTASKLSGGQQAAMQGLMDYYQPMMGMGMPSLQRLLSGESAMAGQGDFDLAQSQASEMLSPIHAAARQQFSEGAGPGTAAQIRESMGNQLPSSALAGKLMQSRMGLESNLAKQLGDTTMKRLTAGEQLRNAAMQRMLGAQQFTPGSMLARLTSTPTQDTAMVPSQAPGLLSFLGV